MFRNLFNLKVCINIDMHDYNHLIKACERTHRGNILQNFAYIPEKQILPSNIKEYLSIPKIIDNCDHFAFSEWKKDIDSKLTKHQTLILSG